MINPYERQVAWGDDQLPSDSRPDLLAFALRPIRVPDVRRLHALKIASINLCDPEPPISAAPNVPVPPDESQTDRRIGGLRAAIQLGRNPIEASVASVRYVGDLCKLLSSGVRAPLYLHGTSLQWETICAATSSGLRAVLSIERSSSPIRAK